MHPAMSLAVVRTGCPPDAPTPRPPLTPRAPPSQGFTATAYRRSAAGSQVLLGLYGEPVYALSIATAIRGGYLSDVGGGCGGGGCVCGSQACCWGCVGSRCTRCPSRPPSVNQAATCQTRAGRLGCEGPACRTSVGLRAARMPRALLAEGPHGLALGVTCRHSPTPPAPNLLTLLNHFTQAPLLPHPPLPRLRASQINPCR